MNLIIPRRPLKMVQEIFSVTLSIVAAFFPKCAFCWAAYASILSSLGLSTVVVSQLKWLYPALIALLILNIYAMWVVAKERQAYTALCLSGIGIVILVLERFWVNEQFLSYLGISIMAAASMKNYFGGKLRCRVVGKKLLMS